MPWQNAVRETTEGCRLLLEVAAGSNESLFPAGYNPWRGRINIRVRATAVGGQANREVVDKVSDFFGLPAAAVEMTSGLRGSHKTLHVPLARDDVLKRLRPAMEWP